MSRVVGVEGVMLFRVQTRRRSAPRTEACRWLVLGEGDSGLAGLEGAPWRAHRSYRAHLQSRGSPRPH